MGQSLMVAALSFNWMMQLEQAYSVQLPWELQLPAYQEEGPLTPPAPALMAQ